MGTGAVAVAAPDRAQQRRGSHLWKKALLHFSLCFVMGFFTGFAPSSTSVTPAFLAPNKSPNKSRVFSKLSS
jgi:hypothetical protein